MGEFNSGKWIIVLIVYFLIFFTVVSGLTHARDYYSNENRRTTFNDPNFDQNFIDQQTCEGGTRIDVWFRNVRCNQLDIDVFDFNGCNNISGCTWKNASDWFGFYYQEAECQGRVNKTHYNITISPVSSLCDSNILAGNESLCKVFKCNWVTYSYYIDEQSGGENSLSGFKSVLRTVWFLVSFRFDAGLGTFNFIFVILFFYIPMVMLIWASYMAIPVIH